MIPLSFFFLGWCVALGGTTALDTLGSQAYTGGSQKTDLSIHFQRAVLVLWILLIPVCVLWYFIESVLLWLDQPQTIARDSQTFLRILIVGAPGYIGFESLKKYLQCQGDKKKIRARNYPDLVFRNHGGVDVDSGHSITDQSCPQCPSGSLFTSRLIWISFGNLHFILAVLYMSRCLDLPLTCPYTQWYVGWNTNQDSPQSSELLSIPQTRITGDPDGGNRMVRSLFSGLVHH